jgi:anti-sigma regulatory factor (Ser/Thr protein kinase)
MCWQLETTMPADRTAPGAARAIVEAQLAKRLKLPSRTPIVDDALLVVDELVTNAVLTGAANVTVSIELHDAELKIEVADGADGWPELRSASPSDSSGRGLALVDALSEAWGVRRRRPVGKSVWARLTVPTGLTSSLNCDRRVSAGGS